MKIFQYIPDLILEPFGSTTYQSEVLEITKKGNHIEFGGNIDGTAQTWRCTIDEFKSKVLKFNNEAK